MKVCKFAMSLGKPCSDGYSKLVECEVDGVVRCLKECMPNCVHYQAKEEPVSPQRAVPQSAVSQVPSFATYKGSTTYTGGCGGCSGT